MQCRFCKSEVTNLFIDLINSPASNSFLTEESLSHPEVFFPLKVYTCSNCYLVQIAEFKKSAAIFNDQYVYFSSFSKSWLEHSKRYTETMIERFRLHKNSKVIELASNDGYLLQYFKERNIPVLGIEPTANTAEVAMEKGIETLVEFFGTTLAKKLISHKVKADLLLGNNVLAHVPDINDFVKGMKLILKDEGVITMEFPHLMQLVDNNQFDTIYHEHYSYLSFYTVAKVFEAAGLEMFDVEELPTHGGSLRIYAKHKDDASKEVSSNVQSLLNEEIRRGMNSLSYYDHFQKKALRVKLDFTEFLINQKKQQKKVAAYGAAAKGNTLLNYCGIKNDMVDYVVDANPYKQNKYLPASHIPVVAEDHLKHNKPDYVIIFPWNLKEEVMGQLEYIRQWGGQFVIPIPNLQVL